LERPKVVEGGARRDLEPAADLAHRRRQTVPRGKAVDEAQDLPLSLRELSHVAASRDPHNTQRVLTLSSNKKRGAQAGSRGPPPDGMIVAVGGAVSTVGTVEGWPTGSDSFRLRFVSTVWRNSSLARRSSRSVRPSIRPSSGSFEGPNTKSAMTPITTNSWSPM